MIKIPLEKVIAKRASQHNTPILPNTIRRLARMWDNEEVISDDVIRDQSAIDIFKLQTMMIPNSEISCTFDADEIVQKIVNNRIKLVEGVRPSPRYMAILTLSPEVAHEVVLYMTNKVAEDVFIYYPQIALTALLEYMKKL